MEQYSRIHEIVPVLSVGFKYILDILKNYRLILS